MHARLTRRRFLLKTGCACGGVVIASRLTGYAHAGDKTAIWPVTCRDAMLVSLKQKDCWSALEAIGAEGIEIQVADDLTLPNSRNAAGSYSLATPGATERLAADARGAGARITALCMNNRFEHRPEMEIKLCGQVASAAAALGVPTIRIDLGADRLNRDELLKFSVKLLRKLIADTEGSGVTFGLENHGTTTNDPEFLTALLSQVNSKRLGITLDTANFYWFGHPLTKLYDLYEIVAPYVMHTHCKNIRYPAAERNKRRPMGWKYEEYGCPIDEGDIDFARVAAILRKAGYRNDLCIEDEFLGKLSPADATTRLVRQVQYLKRMAAQST